MEHENKSPSLSNNNPFVGDPCLSFLRGKGNADKLGKAISFFLVKIVALNNSIIPKWTVVDVPYPCDSSILQSWGGFPARCIRQNMAVRPQETCNETGQQS
jgi:hypothetical protein